MTMFPVLARQKNLHTHPLLFLSMTNLADGNISARHGHVAQALYGNR